MNILEEKEKRKEMIRKGLSKMSLVLSFLYDLWGVWAVGTFLIVLLLSVGSFTAAFWTKKSEPPLSLLPITISSPQDERVNYRLDLGDPRHLYSRYVFVWLPERVSRVLVEVPPLPKGASLLVGVAEGVKSEFMKDTRGVGQITIEIAPSAPSEIWASTVTLDFYGQPIYLALWRGSESKYARVLDDFGNLLGRTQGIAVDYRDLLAREP